MIEYLIFGISIDSLYGMGHFLSYGISLIASYIIIEFSNNHKPLIKNIMITSIAIFFTWHGLIKFSIWNGIRYYENKNYAKGISNLERATQFYPKKIGK